MNIFFKLNKKIFFILAVILLFFSFSVFASNIDGTVDSSHNFAFGEKLGWINFGCTNCNVHVTDTKITGYAWSAVHGWINLSPTGSGVTNNCLGQLGGRAWSKSLGWIDFSGASIDATGKFVGIAGVPGAKTGRVNFGCDNCNLKTDWLQCALRESPAQVLINSITDDTIPTITANIVITNEGLIDTEYQYEWCVVSDFNNACGGGDDIYYSSGAKLITAGADWVTDKTATVPNIGNYYFKLVAHFGANQSSSSKFFTATNVSSGGGGSSGGSQSGTSIVVDKNIQNGVCKGADLNRDNKVNSVDFSILLAFWKTNPPFKNSCVDINRDNKVNSVDFSILLSQWGTSGIILKR